MKSTIILIIFTLIVNLFSYSQDSRTNNSSSKKHENNKELQKLFENDQKERQGAIDWQILLKNDELRRKRVMELLNSDKIKTAKDYENAAWIFQHGNDTISSGMAIKMIKKAIKIDSTVNKWLLAAAIDRDLMRKKKPQIYGTQYLYGADKKITLYELDTTKVTDAERRKYGVETLGEIRLKLKMFQKKKLEELYSSNRSIDEIIEICKKKDYLNSEYDISEQGINMFGYSLMFKEENEEALKIFKLNTELYPKQYNTFDSYGECLIKTGNVKEGIKAYEKSLELNPNNKNAENVIKKLKSS